jgi:hypothetical protein
MKTYLFRFGYMTPAQLKSNEENGWDDEWSYAFFVSADSVVGAEESGVKIADELFEYNFSSMKSPLCSKWSSDGFSYWIDENPENSFSAQQIEKLPIADSDHPDFATWPRL